MGRWALGILVVVVALVASVLGWRVSSLNDELNEKSAAFRESASDLEETQNALTTSRSNADSLKRQGKDLEAQLQAARRRVRNSQPCGETADPHVWLFPSEGPVGTRVEMVGDCFVGQLWEGIVKDWTSDHDTAYGGSLETNIGVNGCVACPSIGTRRNPDACELIAFSDDFDLRFDKSGRMRGHLVVPSEGGCFQQEETRAVIPGRYQINFGCHSGCEIAYFRVTG